MKSKALPVDVEVAAVPTNVRERVKALMASSDINDPREMAEVVLEDMREDELRAALAETLPGYVRVCFHQYQVPQREPESKPASNTHGSTASGSRWDHITAVHSRRVCPAGQWKTLGDCVRDDILALAEQRRSQAAFNTAVADGFEELARRMAARGARRVSDIPVAEIPEVLR